MGSCNTLRKDRDLRRHVEKEKEYFSIPKWIQINTKIEAYQLFGQTIVLSCQHCFRLCHLSFRSVTWLAWWWLCRSRVGRWSTILRLLSPWSLTGHRFPHGGRRNRKYCVVGGCVLPSEFRRSVLGIGFKRHEYLLCIQTWFRPFEVWRRLLFRDGSVPLSTSTRVPLRTDYVSAQDLKP